MKKERKNKEQSSKYKIKYLLKIFKIILFFFFAPLCELYRLSLFVLFLMQNKSSLDVKMFICILCSSKTKHFIAIVRSLEFGITQHNLEIFSFSQLITSETRQMNLRDSQRIEINFANNKKLFRFFIYGKKVLFKACLH